MSETQRQTQEELGISNEPIKSRAINWLQKNVSGRALLVAALALNGCAQIIDIKDWPEDETGGDGGSGGDSATGETSSETSTTDSTSSDTSTGEGGGPCNGTEIILQDMSEYEFAQYRGGCDDAHRIADSLGGGFVTGKTTLCLEPGDKLVTQVHDNTDSNAWQYHLNSGNYLKNVKEVHILQTDPMDIATANLYCTDALTYTNVNAVSDDKDTTSNGFKYMGGTDGVNIFQGTGN